MDGVFILACILAFVFGSIPFGFVIGKLKGVDVRQYGSGNIGATNVSRVLGKKYGALVLLLDALKGALPVLFLKVSGYSIEYQVVAGLSAILGHCFSPFLKFRGGKGVATGLGVFLVVSPKVTLIAFLVFLSVFLTTRYVSLSSITAALSFPLVFRFLEKPSDFTSLILFITAFVVVGKHYQNIIRLLKGEEKKFK
ncbi:glycerol-3-phosphate 1-O-acyltransferase PlsY [Phorcysia thermohydrogeniphila]|uniref:Glycerol-3-phosphate acyltransferase n=1 Tax=Phorcysia thermohydrogeniphila TaxID=936138 RepID=A0A4R1G8W7_9BACT|nr:glycerol-3-phosphate 1-O-acyltransferase PlsY [Phorcysia thermohydrogeniphila]TCK02915.1 acyl-phosphate glycerol-3-phosphate acyltransferase [Phorcysia thermohydrogeniphila]